VKPVILRVMAIAIAIGAVADPAFTTVRRARPIVSIVPAGDANPDLASRVERVLRGTFTVVRGPLTSAAGTVVVGDQLPDESPRWRGPVFSVRPPERRARILGLDAPGVAARDSRVPVTARVSVGGAGGRRLIVQLRAGHLVVDQRQVDLESDSVLARVALAFSPEAAGVVPLRAISWIDGEDERDSMLTAVHVSGERSPVLFHDAHPSWMSTFVRRALENDPRFIVTHRVVTSRGVSSTAGDAPASLGRAADLASFETVVVGAPEALNDADLAGHES
jgi:hypothetical protein